MTRREISKAVRDAWKRYPGAEYEDVSFWSGLNEEQEEVRASVPLVEDASPLLHHIFENGQCHAFALALHEVLGWPVVGCWLSDAPTRASSHIAVRCPGGLTADINALQAIDYNVRVIAARTVETGRLKGFLPPSLRLARHYAPQIAPTILRQHEAVSAGLSKPKWDLGWARAS